MTQKTVRHDDLAPAVGIINALALEIAFVAFLAAIGIICGILLAVWR